MINISIYDLKEHCNLCIDSIDDYIEPMSLTHNEYDKKYQILKLKFITKYNIPENILINIFIPYFGDKNNDNCDTVTKYPKYIKTSK